METDAQEKYETSLSVGKLNRRIFESVLPGFVTDEVIYTAGNMAKHDDPGKHPGDYAAFGKYIPAMLENPDYITEYDRARAGEYSVNVFKTFFVEGEALHLLLGLLPAVADHPKRNRNLVRTFFKIRSKEFERQIRKNEKNKKILYKRETL